MKFRTALVIGVASLLIVVMAALLGIIGNIAERHADETLTRDLARSRVTVSEQWRLREAMYRAEAQRLAEDSRLRAVVGTGTIDAATALGVASDVSRAIAADAFMLAAHAASPCSASRMRSPTPPIEPAPSVKTRSPSRPRLRISAGTSASDGTT